MNKKADVSPIYFIIAGILLFVLVSCSMGNGIINAFKTYKGAEQSFDELSTALSDVSNKQNNLALKLVSLELEENTALFIFTKDKDILLNFKSGTGSGTKMLIEKPTECAYNEQCVCVCKDFKLKSLVDSKSADELNAKYAGKYPGIAPANMYAAECGKDMVCTIKNDFSIPDRITLSEIVSAAEQTRIENIATQLNRGRRQNYIYLWENGFVIWRLSDSSQNDNTQEIFQPNQFMSSKYLDLYVVNNNVNVKICLDPECGKIANNP